ncbi:uncharacterized protein EV154DRAFT_555947 [Mucor mucedo]|uniref:uncharacterized protein n=1 Tax=Mucor mucedo TaxID=29922 RepID=UPI0022211A8A|nr:uncharacterized protein EV154DRAFT_555947 [Mucor mucedo]KAI7874768.1 hypothetical protein EV154DRAFT_555947 [Mucor mucedo]
MICGSQFVSNFTESGTTTILMGLKNDYTPFIVCWSKNPSSPHSGNTEKPSIRVTPSGDINYRQAHSNIDKICLCNGQKRKGCEDFKDAGLSLENKTDNTLKNTKKLTFRRAG